MVGGGGEEGGARSHCHNYKFTDVNFTTVNNFTVISFDISYITM